MCSETSKEKNTAHTRRIRDGCSDLLPVEVATTCAYEHVLFVAKQSTFWRLNSVRHYNAPSLTNLVTSVRASTNP